MLQDKLHHWIEARIKRLDLGGYPEEVQSLRYFGRNARDFAMGIVAIADWGQRYLDKGLRYPIPAFPPYLFTPLPESRQAGSTGTSETISVRRPRRGCSQSLSGVLEVASHGVAVLDG